MTAPPPEITATPTPSLPSLQSALWRLERLFGGTGPTTSNSAPSSAPSTASPSSQSKLLKKFLGSASGTAKSVSLDDIADAALVLDPVGSCAKGRELLVSLRSDTATSTVDAVGSTEEKKYAKAAAREIEGYLLSLAIRTYYRQSDFKSAYQLADKALCILDAHIDECEGKLLGVNVGGLYPLRSRIVRYRSLVLSCADDDDDGGVQLNGETVNGIRADLAKRYRDAVLVKDGDGICTVLNLMLGDLLRGDQGEFWFDLVIVVFGGMLLDSILYLCCSVVTRCFVYLL
jgi:hypothetical protein